MKNNISIRLALLLVQIILCCIAFNKVIFNHDKYLLNNADDAMKNYYIMQSYLYDDGTKNLLHYSEMNYPYGENIFYTDCTPLFTVSVKWFSTHVIDIRYYWLWLFHFLNVINILIATWLTFSITSRLLKTQWLKVLLSLCVPWTNMQAARIYSTSNLTYSSLLLFGILLLICIWQSESEKKNMKYLLGIFVLLVVSFFLHGYYPAIIGCMVLSFFVFWILISGLKQNMKTKIGGPFVVVAAIVVCGLIVRITDPLIATRSIVSSGFNWQDWRTNFLGLFTSPSYDLIKFPIATYNFVPLEAYNYLGAFVLYGCLMLSGWMVYRKISVDSLLRKINKAEQGKFILIFLMAGIYCLIISFGTEIWWNGTGVSFNNVLSPLYWLKSILPVITQFRVLGRFAWPVFFSLTFFIAFVFENFSYHFQKSKWWQASLVLIMCFNVFDTYGLIHFLNAHFKINPMSEESLKKFSAPSNSGNVFQCILPLPYYNSGSDSMNYTIDSDNDWATTTFQASMKTGLPLMSGKLGRESETQVKSLFNFVLHSKPDDAIRLALNDKPILLMLNKNEISGTVIPVATERHPASDVTQITISFVDSTSSQLLFENDSLAYYQWNWNQKK